MYEWERDKVVKNWNFERENTIIEDKWRNTWNVNFIHLKNNDLFNFKNYLKLERRKWKVEINLGSWLVKYLYLIYIYNNRWSREKI